MGRAWALAGAYAGSIIGAGFASGQELLRFFAAFGSYGLLGMCVSGLLFILFGAVLFDRARAFGTGSHQDLLTMLCGVYMGSIIDMMLNIFLFASLGVMLAAAGVLVSDQFALPFGVGVLVTALLTREVVRRDASHFLRLNGVLVIIMVLLTLALLLPVIWGTPLPTSVGATDFVTGMVPPHWLAGAVLYSCFNIALSLSPLGALGRDIRSPTEGRLGALLGGGILGMTGCVILLALLQALPLVATHELPVLMLLKLRLPFGVQAYALVLYLALLTSCIAGAYGLGHRAAGNNMQLARRLAGWLPLLAVPIAYLGFGNLVQTLYPIVGYTGAGIALLALLRSILTKLQIY